MRRVLISILLIFMLGLVSANGLKITNNNFEINKTEGIDYILELQVMNEEPFSFESVFFDSDIIEADTFTLLSGETKNISIKVKTNNMFDGEVRLKGFYFSNLGAENKTHEVRINYNSGLSKCDFSITKGDKVKWFNDVSDEIILRNGLSGQNIEIIRENESYLSIFDTPEKFSYYAVRRGFIFTETCEISVLDTEGLINNPEFDGKLNLNINVNYKPTQVQATFLVDSFNIDIKSQKSDIFSIKNIGGEYAKNISLSGEWITFSENNFELSPGETKTISYTISPYITNTNQTNKTHEKNIKISGNFQEINKNISIFIDYAEVNGINNIESYDKNIIGALITLWCDEFPEQDVCKPKVVYQLNESQRPVTIETTEEQIKGQWDLLFDLVSAIDSKNNLDKEFSNETDKRFGDINLEQEKINENIDELNNSINGVIYSLGFFVLFLGLLVVVSFFMIITKKEKLRSKIKSILGKNEFRY